MPIAQMNTTLTGARTLVVMVAGVTGGSTGYKFDGTPIGSVDPDEFRNQFINRIETQLSGGVFAVELEQVTAGDLGVDFWNSMRFESSDNNWDGLEVLASSSSANVDQNGFFRWNNLVTGGDVFINGQTYNILWT